MTQKQISYFEKAYETGNIALAAEQLFVSRSVISRSIQELEEEFGVVFFERSKNGVVPTAAGEIFHGALLQMTSCYSALTNRFKNLSKGNYQRLLRVGVTPTNSALITNLLFGPFREAHPDIQVQVVEKDHFDMISFLSMGEVDIVALPGQHADMTMFETLPMYDVQIVLAVSEDNPLAEKSKLSAMDLRYTPLAFLTTPLPNVERILYASMEAAKTEPNIAVRTASISILRSLTEKGYVCSFLPDDLIRDWKNVKGIPLDFTSGVTTHKLVWNKAVPLTSAVEDFIAFAQEQFTQKEESPAKEANASGGLSSNFFAELLDLPACKSKGFCDGCGRCER